MNVHEVWARIRLEQGWTYGKERSDVMKTHPCLVPYEDLSEVEKDYDRDTAIGTMKLITWLGFRISKEVLYLSDFNPFHTLIRGFHVKSGNLLDNIVQ